MMIMCRREIIRGRRGSRARRIIISRCFQTTTFRLLRQKEWVVFSSYSSSFSFSFCDDVVFRGERVHEGTMRRSDERHFRCSCVVVVICARAFSFYPFLWWCLVFKISDAEKKKKNDDEYTWTDWRVEDQIFFCFFSLFSFFCRKSAKRRESLFEQNENIFFNFHVRERRRKRKWGKKIDRESPKKKKHCTAALTIIRECVCVCIHLIWY